MREWFESLEPRERLFVSVGAAVVALSLLWGFVWVPVQRAHAERAADVAAWQRSLAELEPLRASIAAADQGAPARATLTQTPIVIVDTTLRQRGLSGALRASQPTTSNGIRVEFENVAFDELVLWLGDLSAQFDMHVQAGSVSTAARNNPGRVNASFTLERAL